MWVAYAFINHETMGYFSGGTPLLNVSVCFDYIKDPWFITVFKQEC